MFTESKIGSKVVAGSKPVAVASTRSQSRGWFVADTGLVTVKVVERVTADNAKS